MTVVTPKIDTKATDVATVCDVSKTVPEVPEVSKAKSRAFSSAVLKWFDKHGRKHLPWQQNPTPYQVWVSEIMLQQTQVTTVIPYFEKFMQRFDTVESLAAASQDEVLSHWSGLGYYARGRNLHRAAQQIVESYDGQLPATSDGLIALPGIGRSTAGAILSLGFKQSAPILDGNVKRVLCRYFCVDGWPAQTAVERTLWSLTTTLTPLKNTGKYNQAMMDLGATVCTRSAPACSDCPLVKTCGAYRSADVLQWPHKKPKKVKPKKFTYMLMAVDQHDSVLLKKRPPTGIWGGLWSLPEFEDIEGLHDYAQSLGKFEHPELEQWAQVKHSFTHYDLYITPVKIALKVSPSNRIMEETRQCWVNDELPGGCAAPVKRLLDTVITKTLVHAPKLP